MKIAAVVYTYNRKKLLEECLISLKNQTHPIDEIIVADDNSTDGTSDLLDKKFKEITHIKPEHEVGGAGCVYLGLECAFKKQYEWIWLMDDDAVPVSNALEELVKVIEGGKIPLETIGALSCCRVWPSQKIDSSIPKERVKFIENTNFASFPLPLRHSNLGNYPKNVENVATLMFTGILISRKAMEKIGLSRREFFIFWDDVEYAQRMIDNGFNLYHVTTSFILHPLWKPIKSKKFLGRNILMENYADWRAYYVVRNEILMYKWQHRHYPYMYNSWNTYLRFLNWFLKSVIMQIIFRIAVNDIGKIKFILKGAMDGILGKTGKRIVKNEISMPKIINKIIREFKKIITAPKNLIFRFFDIPLNPTLVVFMVTDRCNSRCNHCNIWKQEKVKDPLTPKDIEKIFSHDLFKNVKYVLCTGGEATVRDDLNEIFLSFHRALPNATLQLSTNAILPERTISLVDVAMKNGIKLDIGVSLDGIGEAHDRVRGVQGNFQKADWLLHQLVKIKNEKYSDRLNVAAGIVASDLTVDSYNDVRNYTKKLNIDLVEAWYNTSSFYKNYNDGDKSKIKQKIKNIVKSQPPSLLQEKWLAHLDGGPIKFPCFGMQTFCVVKCNGDLVPCLNLWDAKAGNLRDSNPYEVWNSLQAKKVRNSVKACQGCLNTWGAGWSFDSAYYPSLFYYLRHPKILFKRLFSK